MYHLQTSMIQW